MEQFANKMMPLSKAGYKVAKETTPIISVIEPNIDSGEAVDT